MIATPGQRRGRGPVCGAGGALSAAAAGDWDSDGNGATGTGEMLSLMPNNCIEPGLRTPGRQPAAPRGGNGRHRDFKTPPSGPAVRESAGPGPISSRYMDTPAGAVMPSRTRLP